MTKKKDNKPFYKKAWFIVISIIIILAVIGGLSGEHKTKESNDYPNTETNPTTQNNQISEYQSVLEACKTLMEQKAEITSKYLGKDRNYDLYDLNLNELNKIKELETSIKNKLSVYKKTITEKDEEYEFISESLQSSEESLTKINEVSETIRPLQYIGIGTAKKERWTADVGISGILLNVHFFSLPEEHIRAKGKMTVSLYLAGVDGWTGTPVNVRGDLQEEWVKSYDISDFSMGTCGDKKCGFLEDIRLEYSKEHTVKKLNSAGIIEVKFVDESGKEFFAEKIVN
jgi:hypothetical protein